MSTQEKPLSEMTAEELQASWTEYARERLVGRKVVKVRKMNDEEMEEMGWYGYCQVVHFDDDSMILPSQDDEGNGPGFINGEMKRGTKITGVKYEEYEGQKGLVLITSAGEMAVLCDPEGNGVGALFGQSGDTPPQAWTFPVLYR